jgi:hypothetical protein
MGYSYVAMYETHALVHHAFAVTAQCQYMLAVALTRSKEQLGALISKTLTT